MVKILKPGKPWEKPKPWWTKATFRCHKCGCEFQLDESDTPRLTNERVPGGLADAGHACPACGAWIRVVQTMYGPKNVGEEE